MLKEKIINLRTQGFTYTQISNKLSCSKGTISYYLGHNQKEKSLNRQRKNRKTCNPIQTKIYGYRTTRKIKPYSKQYVYDNNKLIYFKIRQFCKLIIKRKETIMEPTFTIQDIIDKYGENPICYLTGTQLNLYEPRTYEFDHKIPRTRGGDNSLDNLGICTKQANQAKRNMTPDEFINLCNQVSNYNKSG